MAEKRLSPDQIPAGGGPATGSDKTREIVSVSRTSGPFGTPGVPTVIPGLSLPLTLPLSGKVSIHASLSCSSITTLNLPASIQLYIRVDGVDHCVFSSVLNIGAPGFTYALSAAGVWAETLSAGPHTFELAVTGNCTVYGTAANPATLVVDYPQDLVGGGGAGDANLVKVDAVGIADLFLTGVNVLIPGTAIAFSLTQTKTVDFTGYATFFGATFSDMFMDLVVDGVTYPGSSFHSGAPSSPYGSIDASRALVLTAGPHTASLVARQTGGAGGQVFIAAGAAPPYLSAVWATGGGGTTTGQATVLIKEEASTVAPFTTVSLPFVVVTGSTLAFSLLESKVVELIAQFPCQGIFALASDIAFGLRIDGIDTPVMKWSQDNAGQVEHVEFTHVLDLAPGLHTISIIAKSNSSPYAVTIPASSDHPIKLTAVYSQPVFGVGTLEKQEAENITGVSTTNATPIYALIPGTALAINLLVDQVVLFEGLACANPFSVAFNTQLGVRIDGVDYHGTAVGWHTIYPMFSESLVVHKAIPLASGSHTAQLIMRQDSAGGGFTAVIENSVDKPSRLTAIYTRSEEIIDLGVAALTRAEAENVTGVATTAPSPTYVPIPGTSIIFALPISQAVLFEGLATLGVSGAFNGRLGLRVDGLDYNGDSARFASFSGNDESALTVSKSLVLAPGSHTVQLLISQAIATGGSALVFNSADKPTRLTVIYTDPEEVVKSFLDYARDDTSGAFSTASAAPVIIPSPTVSFTQHKAGDVEAHLSCVSPINGAFRTRANTWLVLDGTTFIKVAYCSVDGVTSYGLPSGGVAVFPAVAIGSHTIRAALSTEDPFGATVLREFVNAFTPNVSAPLTITVRHN